MIFFVLIFTLLSCTTHAANDQEQSPQQTLFPFDQAQHFFVTAQKEPDIQKRIGILEEAQKSLTESEQWQPTPAEQSVIAFNKGIVSLSLAHITLGTKKQRAYTQSAKTALEQSDNPLALYNLGCMYHLGAPGIQTSPIRAFDFYTRALQAGIPQALTNLQQLQKEAPKKISDKTLPEFSIATLTDACTSPTRKFNIALQAFKDDIPEAALQILETTSTPDSPVAALALFERGRYALTQKKFNQAADLLKQAAQSAPPLVGAKSFKKELFETICQLARGCSRHEIVCYEKPIINKSIYKEVKTLLRIPAQEHYVQAQYLLGLLYSSRTQDLSTPKTKHKKYSKLALNYCTKAADQDYVPAIRECADILQSQGKIKEAETLLKKAATTHQDVNAQRMLAELYITNRNEKSAQKWFTIASENGCITSKANLLTLFEDPQSLSSQEGIAKINASITDLEKEQAKSLHSSSIENAYTQLIDILKDLKAECFYHLAKKKEETKEYTKMHSLLIKAIKTNPHCDAAHIELAKYYLKHHQYTKAQHHYKEASISMNPNGYYGISFMQFAGYGLVPDLPNCIANLTHTISIFTKTLKIIATQLRDKKLPIAQRECLNEKYQYILTTCKRNNELIHMARMTRPIYLDTISTKELATDFIELLDTASPELDGFVELTIAKLLENIAAQQQSHRKKLFNVIRIQQKNKPLHKEKDIIRTIGEDIHSYYLSAGQKGLIEGKYHVCRLYLDHAVKLNGNTEEHTLEIAKKLLDEIIENAQGHEEKNYFEAAAYMLYGKYFEKKGDQDAAWEWYQKAAEFDDPIVVAEACRIVSRKYLDEGNYDKSLEYLERAEPYDEEIQEAFSKFQEVQGQKKGEEAL